MTKIGKGTPPQINQVQIPTKIQQANVGQQGQAGQTTKLPESFEPSKKTLSQQALPSLGASQAGPGTIKAGLMPRNSVQVGKLLDNARKMMDKLDQQINWRTGRLTGQFTDLFKPKLPTTRPPIAAMYGVIMPGPIGGDPGQVKPPGGGTRPPIAAMYGVIMPGPINPGGGGEVKPPGGGTRPPIAAMYGVIMPGPIDVDPGQTKPPGGGTRPPIAAMYGVLMPGTGDWRPPVQPKYGAIRPPMVQAAPNKAQNN